MSLKTEQKLFGFHFTERKPKIYSTGVYLVPVKIEVNGYTKWAWIADEFEDDTYLVGDADYTGSPRVIADDVSNLII